jgi:hypothetical protein
MTHVQLLTNLARVEGLTRNALPVHAGRTVQAYPQRLTLTHRMPIQHRDLAGVQAGRTASAGERRRLTVRPTIS